MNLEKYLREKSKSVLHAWRANVFCVILGSPHPIDQASSGPVTEGRDVEFWRGDLAPNFQHIPKANIIEHDHWRLIESHAAKVVDKVLLSSAVFCCVDKDQSRTLNLREMGLNVGSDAEIGNLLRERVVKVLREERGVGESIPRDDVERDYFSIGG